MRKTKLVLTLCSLFALWWVLERPKLHTTRLAAGEVLMNKGYLPKPGPEHPSYGFPNFDGITGLIERGGGEEHFTPPPRSVAASYPRYEGVQGLIDWGQASSHYPVYDGVSGCIDRREETYALETPNQLQKTKLQNTTTFSTDVDTASYSNIRRFLRDNETVPPNAVRIEEMINYFHYDYPEPTGNAPLSIQTNLTDCPWNKERKLIHIGLQAKTIKTDRIPPLNLVLLIDASGSMDSPDKLPLLRAALREFVGSLREEDRLSLVTYAGSAGVVLRPTSGDQKVALENGVMGMSAGGSTNGARGILTAYELARENFDEKSINRVILATDGDFNVGLSDTADLLSLIRGQRDSGIYLTVLGLGKGDINDHLMEQLADDGNGIYAYLDSLAEARKVLLEQAGSSFVPVADDVKVQVEFDADLVESYRQVGYENRQLQNEDFENDRKDAGEMGAGHQVTALYEVQMTRAVLPLESLGSVRVRYKLPGSRESELIEEDVSSKPWASRDAVRFAPLVAELGLALKHSPGAEVERVYENLRTQADLLFGSEDRKEFQGLVDLLYLSQSGKAR